MTARRTDGLPGIVELRGPQGSFRGTRTTSPCLACVGGDPCPDPTRTARPAPGTATIPSLVKPTNPVNPANPRSTP